MSDKNAQKHIRALEDCCKLLRSLWNTNSRTETIHAAIEVAKTHVEAISKSVVFEHADIERFEQCGKFLEHFQNVYRQRPPS